MLLPASVYGAHLDYCSSHLNVLCSQLSLKLMCLICHAIRWGRLGLRILREQGSSICMGGSIEWPKVFAQCCHLVLPKKFTALFYSPTLPRVQPSDFNAIAAKLKMCGGPFRVSIIFWYICSS